MEKNKEKKYAILAFLSTSQEHSQCVLSFVPLIMVVIPTSMPSFFPLPCSDMLISLVERVVLQFLRVVLK